MASRTRAIHIVVRRVLETYRAFVTGAGLIRPAPNNLSLPSDRGPKTRQLYRAAAALGLCERGSRIALVRS